MSARHRVTPAFASAPMVACLATIVVTSLHAQTSTAANALQVPAAAYIDRVGIFGHSGGGFASTDAMLRYPEFFKVAVSSCGNHDIRSYNIYWSEKYQGLILLPNRASG